MMTLQLSFFKRLLKQVLIPSFLLLIQSCSQTPIGQDLSNSFDLPIEQEAVDNSLPEQKKTSSKTQKKDKDKMLSTSRINKTREKRTASSQTRPKIKNIDRSFSFTPQPYRITIKLSAANPSAPAESVTKALRLAGVEFEVEMIQLIQNESSIKEMRVGRSKR